jgi:molecular chaperone GrpE
VVEGVENLRRGLDSLPADQDENGAVARMRRGFEEVEQNFLALLSRNGVVRDEATGARFDPARHQAVSVRPTDEVAPGVIIQALSAGWSLNHRLLRPAMVIVAKALASESSSGDAASRNI